jgi:hypothetical protein
VKSKRRPRHGAEGQSRERKPRTGPTMRWQNCGRAPRLGTPGRGADHLGLRSAGDALPETIRRAGYVFRINIH